MFRIWLIIISGVFVFGSSVYSQKHYFPLNVTERNNLSISNLKWDDLNLFPEKSNPKNLIMQTDSIIITISNNFKLKICVLYNSAGKISEITFFELKNGNWFYLQKIEHTYDSLNRIIRKLNLAWTGKWENFLLDEYQYKIGDTLEKSQSYFWKDNKWDCTYRYAKVYDSEWDIKTIISENYENGLWVYSTKSSYQMAKDKLSQTHLGEKWNGNSWEYISLQIAKYDNKQRMLSVLSQKWNGISFDDYAKLNCNYTDNNEETQVLQLFQNNEWSNYDSFYYKRNSEGWLLNGRHMMWVDNNRWIDSDGPLSIINPDGLEVHYLSTEFIGYYSKPLSVNNEKTAVINNFELLQNYPNPFNPTTNISYQINEKGFVTLKVYDLIGKEVVSLVNETKSPGKYTVCFNASNLPSGVYLYKLTSGNSSKTNKMLLLR